MPSHNGEAEHAEAEVACAAVAAVAAANAAGAGAAGTDVDGQLVTVPGGSTTSVTTPAPKNTRFLWHGPHGPRTLRSRSQPPVPGGHPAPRRPRWRGPEIMVEISAVKKYGLPDTAARIVSESANTLKFDQSGFEDR